MAALETTGSVSFEASGLPASRDERVERRGSRFVLARVSVGGPGDPSVASLRGQILRLAQASHLGFPAIRNLTIDQSHIEIAMEEPLGALLSHLLVIRQLTRRDVIDIAVDVGHALEQLHELGERHGMVAADHIYLNDRGRWCFRDWGDCFSSKTEREDSTRRLVLQASGSDLQIDVLGLGSVLRACLAVLPPDDARDLHPLVALLEDGREPATIAGFLRAVERAVPEALRPARSEPAERVARREELDSLLSAKASCSGLNTVVLRGGPGTGKTHLVRAFTASLDSGEGLYAACRDWEVSRLGVVRQLFESLVSERGVVVPERMREMLQVADDLARFLRPISPLFEAAIPEGGSVPEAEESDDVHTEALAEVLGRGLQRSTKVLVLDDVQWLDEASRKVLRRVVQRPGLDLLLICATRDDFADALQSQRLLECLQSSIVWDHTLSELDTEQATSVVSQHLSALGIVPRDAHALAALGDGTPLSVLEVVRSVLDAGLLLPGWDRWVLDPAGAEQLRLPRRTTELMAKRLDGLGRSSRAILRLAAVLGGEFDVRVLNLAANPASATLDRALRDAHQFALVERTAPHSYRFVHQCVRDALVSGQGEADLQAIHARIADALWQLHGSDIRGTQSAGIFQLAHHSRLAGERGDPELAALANLEAGRRAMAAFDNCSALAFYTFAQALAGDEHSAGVRACLAELNLRLGNLDASEKGFRSELDHLESRRARAHAWSRLATIYEARYDSVKAIECVERAFDELGEPRPTLGLASAVRLLRGLFASSRIASPTRLSADERERAEQLCGLCFQAARLSVVSSRASSLLDVIARCIPAAEALGPSQALSKAYTFKGFLLSALGRPRAGARATEDALAIARGIDDLPALAHVLMNQAAVVCWQGDTARGLQLGAEGIDRYQNWMIPSEFALIVMNQELLETVRGCGQSGLLWLSRAVARSLRIEGSQPISELVPLRLRAAALHLGKVEAHERELAELATRCCQIPVDSAYHCWKHGPRVRMFTETGDLGEAFEQYVSSVEGEQLDPRKVHLVVVEYYVAVAHARAQQCFRSPDPDRARLLALKRAARDLRLSARVPLAAAHAVVIDGCVRLFQGKLKSAERLFEKAERLGNDHGAPWVLYAAARGRAHLLERQGKPGAARDQALYAERVARTHGAVHRARWIREEFDLALEVSDEAVVESERSRRQAQALARITQAGAQQLDTERYARVVLDELIFALDAEQGYLFQRRDAGTSNCAATTFADLRLVAARRSARSDVSTQSFAHQVLVEQALETRQVQLHCFDEAGNEKDEPGERSNLLVAPLIVQHTVLGAVCLEARSSAEGFTPRDGGVLQSLAIQVPVALELAHALRDRERLVEDLRHSQKMEAVGRLAGGVAHDFNNMLTAIRMAADSMSKDGSGDADYHVDVETIQQAASRASRLTRQLLAFSRRETFEARPVDLNGTISGIVPMIRRLLGDEVDIRIDPAIGLHWVQADVGQIEQVLVNLCVNSWEAMKSDGRLTISTRNATIEGGQHSVLPDGDYGVFEVRDDGHGMDEHTKKRLFEPFFTTKSAESGTGLGMAIVYGIVRQNQGHIEVESAVGKGTVVTIYLPRTWVQPVSMPVPSAVRRVLATGRVLLVDDEPLVRRSFARVLRRIGCEIVSAASGEEAIQHLSESPEVDLVIADVIMPGMNGVELIERLAAMGVKAKVLYVSGFADGLLTSRIGLGDSVDFMLKPTGADRLEEKVRELLRKDDDHSVLDAWSTGE
jgi:signal transduction histidine kinase/ActR/RegA family two-component response regulator